MDLYTKDGYADMSKIMALPYPFIFCVGGRGTGKTYGACKTLLDQADNQQFLFLRRTAEEADLISTTDFSPFAPVIADNPQYGLLYSGTIPHVKAVNACWRGTVNEDGKLVATGDPIGYYGALTTIHKTRGFSMAKVKVVLYDEFQPEAHVHAMRNEGDAFLNMVETVGRNRELKEEEPLKVVCLSNANKLSSPIFQALGIMDKVDRMLMKDKTISLMEERGIALIRLTDSPISNRKAATSLYRAARSQDFVDMALKNDYDRTTYMYIAQEPIEEYKIIASFDDEIYIYRHKSKPRYYVSRHKSGTPAYAYSSEEMSVKRMKRQQLKFFDAWLRGSVSFEDYYCKYLLTNVL